MMKKSLITLIIALVVMMIPASVLAATTHYADDLAELMKLMDSGTAGTKPLPGDTVVLRANVELTKMMEIQLKGVTLDLNGHTVSAAAPSFRNWWEALAVSKPENFSHLITVQLSEDITIKNGKLISTGDTKHGVNVYQSKNVVLEDLTFDHSKAYSGYPVGVNGSTVTIKGELDMTLGAASWKGIDVDPGSANGTAKVTFDSQAEVSMVSPAPKPVMTVNLARGTSELVNTEKVGIVMNTQGVYVLLPKSVVEPSVEYSVPRTGDTANLALWTALLLVSAISFYGLRRKMGTSR